MVENQGKNIVNKVIVVSGGSRGIGAEIVKFLARKGYIVVLNYNKSESCAKYVESELKKEGYIVDIYKADVSKKEEAIKLIKFMIGIIALILAFEINPILGIGLFLIEFLYVIYKKNLEQQILESINHLKDNIEIPKLDILTEKGKSGINILITLLILGIITNFNWPIVVSFIVVFLFTIKDIYSNIK